MPICRPTNDRRALTAGFTLIELLIVLMVIALLAAIMAPSLGRSPAFLARERIVVALGRRVTRVAVVAREGGTPVILDIHRGEPGATAAFAPAIGTAAGPIIYPDGSSNGGTVSLDGTPIVDIGWLDARLRRAAR